MSNRKDENKEDNTVVYLGFFKMKKNREIITGATLLAIITFLGYMFAFLFEAGYLSKFSLPISYIQITLDKVIQYSFVPLFFILFIFIISYIRNQLIKEQKSTNKKDDLPKGKSKLRRFFRIFSNITFILVHVLFMATLVYHYFFRKLNESNFINLFNASVIIIFFITEFALWICEKEHNRNILRTILILVIFLFIVASAGSLKNPSLVIVKSETNKYIVIEAYEDSYLVAPFVSNDCIIPIYSIIKANDNLLSYNSHSKINIIFNQEYYDIASIKSMSELIAEENHEEIYTRSLKEIEYYAKENNITYNDKTYKRNIIKEIIKEANESSP